MSITKQSVSVLFRDLILFIVNFFISILLARTLGPKALAEYFILILITLIADTIFRFKFEIAYVYFGNRDDKKNEVKYISTINIVTCFSLLLFLFIFIFFSSFLFNRWNLSGNIYTNVTIIFLQVLASFFYTNYSYYHIKLGNINVFNSMLLIKTLLFLLLIIICYFTNSLSIITIFNVNSIAILIALLYGIKKLNNFKFTQFKIDHSLLKKMFSYTKNVYLIGTLTQLNSIFFKSVLPNFLSKSNYSFLSISLDRILLINKVPDSINVVLFPKLSSSNDNNFNINIIIKSIRVSFIVLVFLFFLTAPFLNFFIIQIYGIEYLKVSHLLLIIFPGYILYSLSTISNQFFMTNGRNNFILKNLIFFNISLFILFFFLKDKITLYSSAILISISYFILGMFNFYIFKFYSKIKFKNFLPNSSDFTFIFTKIKLIK